MKTQDDIWELPAPDGYGDYSPMQVMKAYDNGIAHERQRTQALVEAMENSIARSDNCGDSYCSQPIRKALKLFKQKTDVAGGK